MGDLVLFETQLVEGYLPTFQDLLGDIMTPQRFTRTALVAVEKNPKLLDCKNRQSLFNTIMGSAVLQLEMDGVTGQAFPIPFGDNVQLVIGYKGYNTLGARAAITITGDVVREDDFFEFDKGEGWVKHRPNLAKSKSPIIAAWAKAAALDRPAVVEALGIDAILDIKARAPSVKAKKDTPWNDPVIGFPAMASKSVKRRLARSLPLNVPQMRQFHVAARLEEAHEEQGKLSWVRRDGTVMTEDGESPFPKRQPNETPPMESLMGPRPDSEETRIKADGLRAASQGMGPLVTWFNALSDREKRIANTFFDGELKDKAREVEK